MSTEHQLIKRVLGMPDFGDYKQNEDTVFRSGITAWHVNLPTTQFCGVQPDWFFLLVQAEKSKTSMGVQRELTENVRDAAKKLLIYGEPVLVVSDVHELRLWDELSQEDVRLFVRDEIDMPEKSYKKGCLPNLSPFAMALRRRLEAGEPPHFLIPYQLHDAATGWRFFGRHKELNTILTSHDNIAVVGGRRIGKTSLLMEAKRRLTEMGWHAYFIDASTCETASQVIAAILRQVSARDLYAAQRYAQFLQDSVLSGVLKRIVGHEKRVVLLIDELGTALRNLDPEKWSFLAVLRSLSQTSQFRVIFSCFQELFLLQQDEYHGPAVNFSSTLRLGTFNDNEVEELAIKPLQLWKGLDSTSSKELLDLILNKVGGHPFFLQAFGLEFFTTVARMQASNVLLEAKALLRGDIVKTFRLCLEEVFYNIRDALPRYLFLKRCSEAKKKNEPFRTALIDDDWLQKELQALKFSGTSTVRRNILIQMELTGLTRAQGHIYDRQVVAAPVVFSFLEGISSIEVNRLLKSLRTDIQTEYKKWNLQIS